MTPVYGPISGLLGGLRLRCPGGKAYLSILRTVSLCRPNTREASRTLMHPPCRLFGHAYTVPRCTSFSPPFGSGSTLWKAIDGPVFNRRNQAIEPPTWSSLFPPFTCASSRLPSTVTQVQLRCIPVMSATGIVPRPVNRPNASLTTPAPANCFKRWNTHANIRRGLGLGQLRGQQLTDPHLWVSSASSDLKGMPFRGFVWGRVPRRPGKVAVVAVMRKLLFS